MRLENNEVNLMFFTGILHLLFFSFYKKLPSFFLLNPPLLHLSYCCIPKILKKLLQPTVPGLVPPHSLVFSPKTLLLRHPLQFFTHPLWFCFIYVIFYFLQHSVLFLSPSTLRSYYLLSLQAIQTIKSVLLSHVFSSNTPWHLKDCSNYSPTRL